MERMEKRLRSYTQKSLVFLVLLALLSSCIQHQEREVKQAETEKTIFKTHVETHYAKGFQLTYHDDHVMLTITDPRNGKEIGQWQLVDRNTHEGAWEKNQIPVPIQSTVCLSTTHFAYFKAIKEQDKVSGAVNVEYSLDQDLKKAVSDNVIEDLTSAGEMNQEEVLEMSPELVLVYPFGDQSYEDLIQAQIPVLNITEYLELDPLAKAEWIKLFGVLTGKDSLAIEKFSKIEKEYIALKQKAEQQIQHKPCVFFNIPFKKTWNCPSGNSYGAELAENAGFEYIYSDQIAEGNLTLEVEKVLHDVENCNAWVIVSYLPGGITKAKLQEEIPGIQVTKAFIENQIYICNTAEVDYFGEACLQPQLLLKDLIYWNQSELLPDHQPYYIQRISE